MGRPAVNPWIAPTAPPGHTREDRVEFLATAANALLAAKDVPGDDHLVQIILPRVVAFWLGGAMKAWLAVGRHVGDLEKKFLRVTAGRSRVTPQEIYRRRCPHPDDGSAS